jgi:hypothetical protein
MANAYNKVHELIEELVNLPSTPSELIREFSECDHRKALYINTALMDETCLYETSHLGCLGQSSAVGAIYLFEIRQNFDRFDHGSFTQVRSSF